jgi:basic membrane protein A
MKVGMVVDTGGLNDYSFNQSAHQGLVKAMETLGCQIKVLESRTDADYEANLNRLASSGYSPVIAVGVLLSKPLAAAALAFPGVRFISIDGENPSLPNVTVYRFREEEGAFLAGALAAMVTHRKKLGFVGGLKIPLIEKFEAGFRAGAMTISPATGVKAVFTGTFGDPEKGREAALKLFKGGADIVFHAAGGSGSGVIDAAHEMGPGFYAIGVDSDQDGMAPGRVLASMIKRVDHAVFDAARRAGDGTLSAGVVTLGLAEGGVGLSSMRYTRDIVNTLNGTILPRVGRLSSMIKSRKLTVPGSLAELKKFKAPKKF